MRGVEVRTGMLQVGELRQCGGCGARVMVRERGTQTGRERERLRSSTSAGDLRIRWDDEWDEDERHDQLSPQIPTPKGPILSD